MALHKEPYGLVYNDDGSLCVTLREDVVPFAGVKSFAVEGEATNLVAPYSYTGDPGRVLFYPVTLASGKTWADCWDEEEKAFILGHRITVHRIGTHEINLGQTYPAGTKVTISWKHKGYFWCFSLYYYDSNAGDFVLWNKDSDEIEIKGDASLDYWEHTFRLHIKLNGLKPDFIGEPEKLFDRWYNVEITFTLPVDTDKIKLLFDGYKAYQVNTVGLLRHIQAEVKPFATSFVDGTSPKGRLVIPVEDLKLDIANDDWVISYWKYPVATHDGTQNGYNLCSLGRYTSDFSKGYIRWGKERNSNIFRLVVVYNDRTWASAVSSTFDPNWYFNNWHFEVKKKQGKVLSYYVDGVKQYELIIPADKEIQTPFDVGLSLGGYSGSIPNNALIANLLIARYNPNIWTDAYIRELYNARKPFALPPRMPII